MQLPEGKMVQGGLAALLRSKRQLDRQQRRGGGGGGGGVEGLRWLSQLDHPGCGAGGSDCSLAVYICTKAIAVSAGRMT